MMRTQKLVVLSLFAVAAAGVAACSGGSGSAAAPPFAKASPILVAGTTTKFSGTDTIVHVYASPTGTQANFTEAYAVSGTSVLGASASGAPAPFDQNVVTTYTATQAPPLGTQRTSAVLDTYLNQTVNGASVTVTTAGSKTTTIGTDVSAGLAGGGPFTITTTTTTNLTTPNTSGVYPLVAGTVYAQSFAKTATTTTSDVNAGSTSATAPFATQQNDSAAADSSFTRTATLSNGEQQTLVELPNGSATLQETGPIFALSESIGVPVAGSTGTYAIPITQSRQNATVGATPAPSATPGSFSAADWYVGGALPAQPLSTENVTVKGPVTTLPAACNGAISEPNVVELDLAETSLDVFGSYLTETQQRFDSNGINVCVLRTITTQYHSLLTGLPSETSTETYVQTLTSLTAGSGPSSSQRAAHT